MPLFANRRRVKELSSIEFTFENCDYFSIPTNVIGDIKIPRIQSTVARNGGRVVEINMAESIVLEIFKDGNTEYTTPTGELELKFDRLTMYNDITQLTLYFADGSVDIIYPYYSTTHIEENIYQKSLISDVGNLYLVIDKNKSIADYFDISYLTHNADARKKLYRTGVEKEKIHTYDPFRLPDLYRYVLFYDADGNEELGMRVDSHVLQWEIIYAHDNPRFRGVPKKWKYLESDLAEWLDSGTDEVFEFMSEGERKLWQKRFEWIRSNGG